MVARARKVRDSVFFSMDFAVFTARSASRFACGNLVLDVECFMSQSLVNCVNSAEAYCGPLSDHSGMPCLANMASNTLMTTSR